jgi:adenylyltransferase/sulfurtransferase
MYLAASGVGNLILCDHDTISISNLNRQLLYPETEIGQRKVEIATCRLSKINPGTACTQLDEKFSWETVISSPKPQLILDCLDNFQSRVDLAGFAFRNDIPLVHGAIHGFMGQMTFFWPGVSACPVCIVPEDMNQNNTVVPAVGACAGLIGSMQALEAIKYFTGLGELYTNRFMLLNGLSGCFEEIIVEVDLHCSVCRLT